MTLPGTDVEVVTAVGDAIRVVQVEAGEAQLDHHETISCTQFIRVNLVQGGIRIPDLLTGQPCELLVKGHKATPVDVRDDGG